MGYKQTTQKITDMPINLVTIFIAIVLLISAIYIYLSNRTMDMQLYLWLGIDTTIFEQIRNLSCNFAPWAIYNLPDGLWLLSFLLFMEGIWNREKLIKWVFCIILITFAFISEILQFNGYFSGTGDILDIVFYVAAVLLLILLIKLKQMYYEKNN